MGRRGTAWVQIEDHKVSIIGEDVGIDSVTPSSGIEATISKGTMKVPITGSLDEKGTGSGTWQTMGGLLACTGSWSAKRSRPGPQGAAAGFLTAKGRAVLG